MAQSLLRGNRLFSVETDWLGQGFPQNKCTLHLHTDFFYLLKLSLLENKTYFMIYKIFNDSAKKKKKNKAVRFAVLYFMALYIRVLFVKCYVDLWNLFISAAAVQQCIFNVNFVHIV